jgi:hypothetical protein
MADVNTRELEARLRAANAEWWAKKQAKLAKRSVASAMYPHLRSTVGERDATGFYFG